MHLPGQWKGKNEDDEIFVPSKDEKEFLKTLVEAIDENKNYPSGINELTEKLYRKKITNIAQSLEKEGILRIEEESRERRIKLTEIGERWLNKFKIGSDIRFNLKAELDDFVQLFGRYPRVEELSARLGEPVDKEELYEFGYQEPTEEEITRRDSEILLFHTILLTASVNQNDYFDEEMILVPRNFDFVETDDIEQAGIEDKIDSYLENVRERVFSPGYVDEDTLDIYEEKGEFRFQIKIPEPYRSYFDRRYGMTHYVFSVEEFPEGIDLPTKLF